MNERVRAAAKECIQAVFSAPTQTTSSTNYELESKMRGFGGGDDGTAAANKGSYVGTYYTPNNGSGTMPGFGSGAPAPADAASGTVLDNVKNAFGSLASLSSFGKKEEVKESNMYDPPSGSYQVPQAAFGGSNPAYGGGGGFGGGAGYNPNMSYSSPAAPAASFSGPAVAPSEAPRAAVGPRAAPKKKEKRKKGEVPMGSVFGGDGDAPLPQPTGGAPSGGWNPAAQPSFNPPAALNPAGFGGGMGGAFGGGGFGAAAPVASPARVNTGPKGNRGKGSAEVEGSLVAELCVSAGVKAVPPQEKLQRISANWANLDQWFVAEELDSRLYEEEKWQVQKKALIVLEKLAEIDAETLKEYFQENPENLAALATSTSNQAKKARAFIELLDIDVDLPEESPAGNVGGDESESTPYAAAASSPSPAVVRSSPAAVVRNDPNLVDFGGLTISQPAPQPTPAFVAAPVAQPSPFVSSPVKPVATPSGGPDLLDLFGTPASAAPSAAKPQSGMEFLQSVQSASKPAPELSFAPAASTVNFLDSNPSSFGFLSGGAAAAPAQPAMGFGFGAPVAAPSFNAYGASGFAPAGPGAFGVQPGFGAQPAFAPQPGYGAPAFGYGNAAPAFNIQAAQPDLFSTAQPIPAARTSNANRGTSRQSAPKKPDEFSFVQDMMSGN
jgi:hypothetical protein